MQLIEHTCSNGIGGCCLGDAIGDLEVMDGIEYAAMKNEEDADYTSSLLSEE